MTADGQLAGRTALVTGASGSIGGAIARALAPEVGALALAYGSGAAAAGELAEQLTEDGVTARAYGADLADRDDPTRLVETVAAELGPVDVLVACQGTTRHATYLEIDGEEFDEVVAVNLRASYLLARAALPGMCERGFGRVLFVSSLAALVGGVASPAYAASKAGLHGLTHYLARQVAADGVTVNALAPGLVDTPMLADSVAAKAGETVPLGRVAAPEEIAEFAVAVLSSTYVTSKVHTVDGGMVAR